MITEWKRNKKGQEDKYCRGAKKGISGHWSRGGGHVVKDTKHITLYLIINSVLRRKIYSISQ